MEADHNLDAAERRLLTLANSLRSTLRSRNAVQHVKDGFMHRLLISQQARLELGLILDAQGDRRLEPEQSVRLSLFLGAFYLNLVGALDNLAWAMAHEHHVDGRADEEGRGRTSVGLFKAGFLKTLAVSNADLAARLTAYKPWFSSVTSMRDPAAHRIPPGFVSGHISDADRPEFERLMAESDQAFADLNAASHSPERDRFDAETSMVEHNQFMGLLSLANKRRHEAGSLSTFIPVVVTFTPDGHKTEWAPTLIPDDQKQFVEVSTLVLHALKRQDREGSGAERHAES